MTNGTLDGISLAIGSLQADVKNVMATQDRIFNYVKNSNDSVLSQLAAHVKEDDTRHVNFDNDLEGLKSFRNRVYGVTAVTSLIVTSLSNTIPSILKKMFT